MLIFAFQEGLKIHEISSSKLIKEYCEEYIQKECQHEAKNLAKRLPKLSKMGRISVTGFGLKRLGCLKAAIFRFEDIKAPQKDPKKGSKWRSYGKNQYQMKLRASKPPFLLL